LDCKKGNVLFICSPANPVLFIKKAILWEGNGKSGCSAEQRLFFYVNQKPMKLFNVPMMVIRRRRRKADSGVVG
jgi:hypothetical protein